MNRYGRIVCGISLTYTFVIIFGYIGVCTRMCILNTYVNIYVYACKENVSGECLIKKVACTFYRVNTNMKVCVSEQHLVK